MDQYTECKKCKTAFQTTSILRHLSQKADCKTVYSDEELSNLRSGAKERASKKRKIWKKENKDYLSDQNARYHIANREKILQQKSNYYTSHKVEISKQKAKRYEDFKDDKEVQWLKFDWLLHAPKYYEKKKNSLSKCDKGIWGENGQWQEIIDELKNSKLATKEICLQLDNLKRELDSKITELHESTRH